MLLFLNPKNKYHRVLRRGVVVGLCVAVSMLINVYLSEAPGYAVPVLTAIIAMLDKLSRELKDTKTP